MLGSLFLKNVNIKITEVEVVLYFFLEYGSVRFLKQRLGVAFTSTLYSGTVHYQNFFCGFLQCKLEKTSKTGDLDFSRLFICFFLVKCNLFTKLTALSHKIHCNTTQGAS